MVIVLIKVFKILSKNITKYVKNKKVKNTFNKDDVSMLNTSTKQFPQNCHFVFSFC